VYLCFTTYLLNNQEVVMHKYIQPVLTYRKGCVNNPILDSPIGLLAVLMIGYCFYRKKEKP
jgi:hypothetical protein